MYKQSCHCDETAFLYICRLTLNDVSVQIAFVHNSFPAGGAERITLDIAKYLSSFDSTYKVFVYATHIGEFPEDIPSCLTVRKIPSQAVLSRRSKAIEALIVQDKVDILVEVTKSLYDIEGIRSRTGVKVVLACHGEVFWQRYAIMHRRQKKALLWSLVYKRKYADGTFALEKARKRTLYDYRNCDAYTVLCDDYKCQLERDLHIDSLSSHVTVIENPERALNIPMLEKENIILFCGRFENWSKRIDRLMRIWSKVQGKLPEWTLILVGDGPDMKKIRAQAQELALERVIFEGKKADVRPYYNIASVVCLTSQTEGWPLALSEGQAYGCIGVAFDSTAGIREILSPSGQCGFLVKPFDEDEYADVLLRIASLSSEESLQIRENGIEKRRQYRPEIIARKWKSLFDNLMHYENI